MIGRDRADLVLLAQKQVPSREKARDLIKQGLVSISGEQVKKPSQQVPTDSVFQIEGVLLNWVSRGALKLSAALGAFDLPSFSQAVCIDLGASTGGFTDVLLHRGARHIYSVDVGHGQLADALAKDGRVTNLEKTHARDLSAEQISQPIDVVVCDLSFISVTKALSPALSLVRSGGWLVTLIKPQFEAGRDALGKGGVVRLEADRQKAIEQVRNFIENEQGWQVKEVMTSPIKGSDGNIEYLMSAQKSA